MTLALVTDVIEEPVSLADQKTHLRIDIDEDDAYIAGCVTAARAWVEGQTKRAIMPQTWNYIIDYCWPAKIELPMNPVASVTSINYIDTNGTSQTLATNQYTVAARKHGSFIVPAYDVTWPDVQWVPAAVTVQFIAGVAAEVPQEIHRAIMILAGAYYENRETVPAPMAVESLISPYRKASFA